jgi:cytochrome c-type biogenesis protein
MSFLIALGSAFWLGILTSVSPCPLAANIAAISFLARDADRPGRILISGGLYSLGRVITYVGLGLLLAGSLLNIPQVAFFLQNRMNQFLGPVLILAGMILAGWIRPRFSGLTTSEDTARRLTAMGYGGSLLLGVLFALSFCPVSAGLFFGSLLPLSLQQSAPFSLPLAYGLGTALPVLAAALGIALGIGAVTRILKKTSTLAARMRKFTGWVFLLVGVYTLYRHLLIPFLERVR